MRKADIFVARLARGAVVSGLAAFVPPQSHTVAAVAPVVAHEATANQGVVPPQGGTHEASNAAVTFRIGQAPTEWEKGMEREFRQLALQEAKGTLSGACALRLEELNRWRDRLLCPQPPEEMLLQIKRDRLLARMEEVLNDYVEFQETTDKKRAAA